MSEATSGRLLVSRESGMCEERSDELKEFLEERLHGMLFLLLSLRSSLVLRAGDMVLLLSLRSSRPSLLV